MPLFGGYKASKLKPQLKMAVSRFTIASNKKKALMKQQIREIALLLAEDPPKEEKARIKAEALIRDDDTVEAYEILQLSCELLSERINLITHSKECPSDMVSTVATLIWASAIVDIPELIEVRKQLRYKFGREFDEASMSNVGGILNERVTAKLSITPPSAYKVQTYLEKISDEHEVGWKPTIPLRAEELADPMAAPDGRTVQEGAASGLNKKNYDVGSKTVPPLSSTVPLPVAPKAGDTYEQLLPTPAIAVPAVTEKSQIEDHGDDIIEEPDIYVPAAPKSQPGSDNNNSDSNEVQRDGRTQSAGENSRSNNDDEDETGGDLSYDDLAKRFAELSK